MSGHNDERGLDEKGRAHKKRPPAHSHTGQEMPARPLGQAGLTTNTTGSAAWLPAGIEVGTDRHPNPDFQPLRLRRGDRSKVKPVEWLWRGRIPIGKLSLLVAEESGGKGTLEAWLIVRALRGELPGDRQGSPLTTLVIGDEDGFEDTWMPRLHAAGASWDEIDRHVWTLEPNEALDLTRSRDRLAQAVKDNGIGWVIFDALMDHIDGGRDGASVYNPKAVRAALRPLRDVARETGIAATGNLHPIKGNPKTFRELIGSSHQFNAVARSSLWLGSDPDAEDTAARVVVRGKGNLSAEPPCFEFAIDGKQLEISGRKFDLPVVSQEREGSRYRRDFEGGPGSGFGQKATMSAPERDALRIEPLLNAEFPQGPVKLAERSGINRRSVTRALELLQEQGRADKAGEGKQAGWISVEHDRPGLA
jgi:hypothetical protein